MTLRHFVIYFCMGCYLLLAVGLLSGFTWMFVSDLISTFRPEKDPIKEMDTEGLRQARLGLLYQSVVKRKSIYKGMDIDETLEKINEELERRGQEV